MSRRKLAVLLALLAVGLPRPGGAEGFPDEVAAAIDGLDRAASAAWSYVRTAHDGRELRVERYTHGVEDPWTLVSVGGIPASEAQREAYAKRADERVGRDHPGEVDVRSMIEPGSLLLEENTEAHALYRFQPRPDDDDDDPEVMRALTGSLRVDRGRGTLEWIEMESKEPFSPQTGVRIERMLMRMEFAAPEASRPGFIVAIRNDVDATIAGAKSMDQRQSVRFHDFAPGP